MDRIELGTQSLREYRGFADSASDVQGTENTDILNQIKAMLITYTNTNALKYGQNVKTIKIIDEKQITEKNFDRVVANVKHFLDKFDEQEIKIKQFLSTLNLDDYKSTVVTLTTEINEKMAALEDYKEKFYKNVKSQLSVNKDFQ